VPFFPGNSPVVRFVSGAWTKCGHLTPPLQNIFLGVFDPPIFFFLSGYPNIVLLPGVLSRGSGKRTAWTFFLPVSSLWFSHPLQRPFLETSPPSTNNVPRTSWPPFPLPFFLVDSPLVPSPNDPSPGLVKIIPFPTIPPLCHPLRANSSPPPSPPEAKISLLCPPPISPTLCPY